MKKDNLIYLIVKILGGILFYPFWHLQKLLPRKNNVWIFGSWFGHRYSDNSRAVFEYVLEHRPDILPVWITHDKNVYNRLRKENKPVEMAFSPRGILTCLKAGVTFITTSPKELNAACLNGSLMIWLWHGVGVKGVLAYENKFKQVNYTLYKKFKIKINRILFPYESNAHKDFVITTSEFFYPSFSSMFEVSIDKLWDTGLPRNDALFSNEHEKITLAKRTEFPNARFVIYMPTHRINALSRQPFNGFDFPDFQEQAFYDLLEKEDIVFFNKGHFFDRDANIKLHGNRFINLTDNDYDNLYVLIKDMDILITDFSSIYCDFLLLGKPMILAPFDFDTYVTKERCFIFDYNEQKAIKAHNWNELIKILKGRTYFSPLKIEQEKFLSHIDGNNCERVVNKVFESIQKK